MTCDPVKGLVQVPCIERNGLGAIKAVSAASLALYGDGSHFMPLDNCIRTLRETGRDMDEKVQGNVARRARCQSYPNAETRTRFRLAFSFWR